MRNGSGTNTWADGEVYVGEWKNDLPHGEGIATYADGRVEEGVWGKGYLKYSKK
tara:strand:+ start:197 stop:358 length:162 start_codon:yes stop_codon:yes gene_type:complete